MKDLITEFKETKSEEKINQIFSHYDKMINSLSYQFSQTIRSYDFEDLKREAQLELLDSLNDYNVNSNTAFSTYAYLRIKNRFIRIFRYNNAKKRNMGNYVTLESKIGYSNLTFESMVADSNISAYESAFNDTYAEALCHLATFLSVEELEIYLFFLKTNSYTEVAKNYKIEEKRAKNKVTYIKRKIKNNRKNDKEI